MPKKRYRIYIDESGDHTFSGFERPEKRFLGITGIIFSHEHYRNFFHPNFSGLKQKHFPHNPDDPIIFHRKELISKKWPFCSLKNPENEKKFNDDFLSLLIQEEYSIISVVIDKKVHVDRYQELAFHPYHYCLVAILERYCGFLNFYNADGDVMAESRGGKEDMQLKEAYQRVFESGTQFRSIDFFQSTLTSKEIKIKKKEENILGLQLADLLAHPCKNEILFEKGEIQKQNDAFGLAICKNISKKYNRRQLFDQVDGYGKVFLS